MFLTRLNVVLACTFLFSTALADDALSSLEVEKRKSAELAKAMQNAQLLLSSISDLFECDYDAYDVRPRQKDNNTIYLVIIDVEKGACDDMIETLNGQGEMNNLVFVSERRMPSQNSELESEPAPFEERSYPPTDYSLIHEVDPGTEQ